VKLFRNDGTQVVSIPPEFELQGEDVIIQKCGDRLIIKPAPKYSLLEWLATLEPIDEDFPEIEDLPPRDVNL
jgi:antitoxin VapB